MNLGKSAIFDFRSKKANEGRRVLGEPAALCAAIPVGGKVSRAISFLSFALGLSLVRQGAERENPQ